MKTLTDRFRVLQDFAVCVHALKVDRLCLGFVPLLMGGAWFLFPFLESNNIGYLVWDICSLFGLMVSGFGILCWISIKWILGVATAWVTMLLLLVCAVGCLMSLVCGDFYWAFDRGYFL